jgi:hypothetical protein
MRQPGRLINSIVDQKLWSGYHPATCRYGIATAIARVGQSD